MAHNFRLSAANNGLHISKAGSNGNPGTKDLPSTLEAYIAGATGFDSLSIIGTGSYKYVNASRANCGKLKADGTVKILGDGATRMILTQGGAGYENIYFDQFAGFTFRAQQYTNPNTFRACIFKVLQAFATVVNSGANDDAATAFYEDCLFFNVKIEGSLKEAIFRRCLFFNCSMTNPAGTVDSCYIDANSSIRATVATNNNVDPGCDVAGAKGLSVNGGSFSLASPAGISALPLFNSVVKEDFTLRAASPHILKGIGPTQYRYADSYYGEFSGGLNEVASQANVRLRGTGSNTVVPLLAITDATQAFEVNAQGGLVLSANETSVGFGTFTTGRIPFSDVADEMTVMLLKAGLNFDTDFPALENQFNYNQPAIYNNNVPDFSNYAPGNAGRNPNRLSYRMRWSTKPNPNANLSNVADWITGTNFIEFEWNEKPLWNPATGIGNGDAAFDPALAQPIQCTFYQLQICLRNNYFR